MDDYHNNSDYSSGYIDGYTAVREDPEGTDALESQAMEMVHTSRKPSEIQYWLGYCHGCFHAATGYAAPAAEPPSWLSETEPQSDLPPPDEGPWVAPPAEPDPWL